MKKAVLLSGLIAMTILPAAASDMLPAGGYYETSVTDCNPTSMRRALDAATHARRAVVTVVRCDNNADAMNRKTSLQSNENQSLSTTMVDTPALPVPHETHVAANSLAPVERVVARQYYVTETVVRYAPVVTYVPDGTYTRTRPVCDMCGR